MTSTNRQKQEMLELLRGYKRSNLPLLVLRRLFSAAIVFGLNQQTFSIQRLILENKKTRKFRIKLSSASHLYSCCCRFRSFSVAASYLPAKAR